MLGCEVEQPSTAEIKSAVGCFPVAIGGDGGPFDHLDGCLPEETAKLNSEDASQMRAVADIEEKKANSPMLGRI